MCEFLIVWHEHNLIKFSRLFDHIVDNEVIANAILDRMEREGLPGDVRFLACQNMNHNDIGPDLRDVNSSPINSK